MWDTFAYGTLQGSWEWTFMLDYNYLEPLALAFEVCNLEGTSASQPSGSYLYNFSKSNTSRVKSFTVRRIILNQMAGGPSGMDEMEILKGCVCKSITFARSAGTSQVQVTMSGFYASEEMTLGNISSTDYKAYSGNLVEYSCLFAGKDTNNDGVADEFYYVANTESLTVSIDNSAEAIYNVCSPFAKQYSEGITDYTFSTTAYSNDPSHYKQKVYSGGQILDTMPTSPMCKGMAPLAGMKIQAMNLSCDNGSDWNTNWNAATQWMEINITKCVIRSLQWQSGDGGKLQDSISSAECQSITFSFRSTKRYMTFDASNVNKVTTQTRSINSTRSISEVEDESEPAEGDGTESR